MITLYPHQDKFIQDLRFAFREHQCVLGVAATGFGKTIASAFIAKSIIDKKNLMYFTVHRDTLIVQTKKAFDKFNIEYGIISPNHWYSHDKNTQICSIATLQRRLDKYPIPNLLVVDEAHFSCAKGWSKVIDHYKEKGAKVLGLSASPRRLSGEGLNRHFQKIVEGPKISWLIENRFLSDYKIYAPSSPKLERVNVIAGDYNSEQLNNIMDKPYITGSVVDHWNKYAKDKRTLAFCVSIKHSKHICETLNNNGIPTAHLDGESTTDERIKVINDFAEGKIKIISSCMLFTEGFDLSLQSDKDINVEAIILLRPTLSLALFLQMCGRGLRYKPYPAIILDHANCVKRHGLPCEDREWTLEGNRNKRNKSEESNIAIKQCPKCYFVVKSHVLQCPECNHIWLSDGRIIKSKDGELSEIDKENLKKQKRVAQGMARTLEDLVQVGRERGYRKPYWWAKMIIKAREAKNKGA